MPPALENSRTEPTDAKTVDNFDAQLDQLLGRTTKGDSPANGRPGTGQNLVTNLDSKPSQSIPNTSQPIPPALGTGGAPTPLESLIAQMPAPTLTAEQERAQQYVSDSGRWEPKRLNARHREMMRRIIEGATYTDIALEMGLSVVSVHLVCTSKLFLEELTELEAGLDSDVIKRAENMSNEALDTIKQLMRNARSEALRKSCADRILDTAGYSKVEKKLIGLVDGEAVIRELHRRRLKALNPVNGESEGEPESQ